MKTAVRVEFSLGAVPLAELLDEIARRYTLQCTVQERRRTDLEAMGRDLERVTRERDEALAQLRAAGGAS